MLIGILTGLNTTIQLRAPATAAPILSLYMLVLSVGYPVGAIIQGAVGRQIGVREVTIAGAAVMMAALVAIRAQAPEVFGSLGEGKALAGNGASSPSTANRCVQRRRFVTADMTLSLEVHVDVLDATSSRP